jgi:hypothetical protein
MKKDLVSQRKRDMGEQGMRLFKFLKESEGATRWSTIRLVLFLWAVLPLLVWAGISVYRGEVQAFPTSIATIIGALGIGKAVQRFAERCKA